jgi:hypothetical protein
LRDVRAFAVNDELLCAALGDGALWCNGKWEFPLRGVRTPFSGYPVIGPGVIARTPEVRTVALWRGGICVLTLDGIVRCLQPRESGRESRMEMVAFPEVPLSEELIAGKDVTCARTRAGDVYCWGTYYGLPPRGVDPVTDRLDRDPPRPVEALRGAVSLSRTFTDILGSMPDGRVVPSGHYLLALPIVALHGARQVVGAQHLCGRFKAGVRCMGVNHLGQLGDGRTEASEVLVDVQWP